MKLIILAIFFLSLEAKMVDAIAVIVNSEPITTYEIEKSSKILNIPPQQALELLIRKKLEKEQIKKLNISVDEFELQSAIENFAKKRGLDIFSLREKIEQSGTDWQEYKKSFKEHLLREKLYKKVAQITQKNFNEDELKEYYNRHKNEFEIAKEVEIVKYISPSKSILEKIRQNPLFAPDNPSLLQKGEEVIELSKVSPEFATLLQQTPEGEFTQILPLQNSYLLIYIKSKRGKKTLPFEEVKGYILNKLSNKNSAKSVEEYFDRLKASAKIKILR
jgi:parvulin-like peptidyl-prolyl isomerase